MPPNVSGSGDGSPPLLTVDAKWWGGRVFETQVRDHRLTLDATGTEGARAMEALLAGLAACLGSVVADLLETMRLPADGLEVRVAGRERPDRPRTFASVDVEVCLTRVDREKAERAVALAHETYCPVSAMFHAAGVEMRVTTVIVEPLKPAPARA